MSKAHRTLEQCIEERRISRETADKYCATISNYITDSKGGYLIMLKDGFGDFHGHELPPTWSERWRDSVMVHLEQDNSPEELLAAAIERSIPI